MTRVHRGTFASAEHPPEKLGRFIALTPSGTVKVVVRATSTDEAREIAQRAGLDASSVRPMRSGERPGSVTATLAQWERARQDAAARRAAGGEA